MTYEEVFYGEDGCVFINWNHDANMFLDDAINKFNNGCKAIERKYEVGNKYVIWIQGESDAKYGSDTLYYKESLKSIANRLKNECGIDKMFVSLTGYWLGAGEYFVRTRRIAVAQEVACEESDVLCLGSKRAMTFHGEKLTIDDVHYSQEGLNILGRDLCENIYKYHITGKKLQLEDTVNLDKERKYIKELSKIHEIYA